MIILGIDSSAKSASSAVVDDGHLLSEVFVNNGYTHSKTLMNVIDDSIKLAGVDLSDIDLIACVNGPGSFTGIRIGVSCAKGIAFTGNIKCAGISTLEAMAYNALFLDGYICGVMDARCSQVYTAIFKCKDGVLSRITEDKAVGIDDLISELEKYNEKVYLFGDGAHLIKAKSDNPLFILTPENIRYQRACGAAFAAANKEDYIFSDELVPVYLRLPQAERELKNKLKGDKK